MREAQIKVKAFAVLLNRSLDAHLVWRGSDATKSPADFHRLLGGHVEFGEATIDAVRREIMEETAAELQEPHLLGVVESEHGTPRQRFRIEVYVANEVAEHRFAVAAGGTVVDDSDAPALTVIADQDGNTGVVCVAESPATKD